MSTKYAIVGGKLIDGTGAEPVENSLVLVDDNGKIEYAGAMQDLPEGVEVIDAAGKTVLPGHTKIYFFCDTAKCFWEKVIFLNAS